MSRLANVNTTDIASVIELGCRTMSNAFDADDADRPFFESTILPEAKLAWNSSHSEAHEPDRHLAFPLTEHELVLHHRMHDIRVRIRGDAVRAMQDFGAELTFFEPM
jgi:hypothetical protein